MKDFVQNADAILNGDPDYFRGLHNIEIETYMKGAELLVWACWHCMHRCNQAVARLYREKRRRELSGVWNLYNF